MLAAVGGLITGPILLGGLLVTGFLGYLFYVFFLGLPRELEEAARMDGAGVLGTYFRIIVPNAKPAFATVAILTFLFQWGQYLWPLLVTSGERVRPLPVAIAGLKHPAAPAMGGYPRLRRDDGGAGDRGVSGVSAVVCKRGGGEWVEGVKKECTES